MLTQFQLAFETSDAFLFARAAHAGQVYHHPNGDEDYINHPVRVANRLVGPRLQVKALLHDVVEDTPITVYQVFEEFGQDVADSINALSRRDGEEYEGEYLPRLVRDHDALLVKLADVEENRSALPGAYPVQSKWARLATRYERARLYLLAARDIYPTLQRFWREGQAMPDYDLVLEIQRLQRLNRFDIVYADGWQSG